MKKKTKTAKKAATKTVKKKLKTAKKATAKTVKKKAVKRRRHGLRYAYSTPISVIAKKYGVTITKDIPADTKLGDFLNEKEPILAKILRSYENI